MQLYAWDNTLPHGGGEAALAGYPSDRSDTGLDLRNMPRLLKDVS